MQKLIRLDETHPGRGPAHYPAVTAALHRVTARQSESFQRSL